MKPSYIVTGLYRSGTSMMMRCLIKGGLKAHWEIHTDELNNTEGYQPNPHGFFQFPVEQPDPAFPYFYAGYAIKLHHHYALSLPKGNYKIILMRRDPAELRRSTQKAFLQPDDLLATIDFYDLVFPAIQEKLSEHDLTTVDYAETVANPNTTLKRLQENGWPITADFTHGVNSALYRNRA